MGQIKNITSIAQALASVQNTPVTYDHLEMAMKANAKFVEEYINASQMNGLDPVLLPSNRYTRRLKCFMFYVFVLIFCRAMSSQPVIAPKSTIAKRENIRKF